MIFGEFDDGYSDFDFFVAVGVVVDGHDRAFVFVFAVNGVEDGFDVEGGDFEYFV